MSCTQFTFNVFVFFRINSNCIVALKSVFVSVNVAISGAWRSGDDTDGGADGEK